MVEAWQQPLIHVPMAIPPLLTPELFLWSLLLVRIRRSAIKLVRMIYQNGPLVIYLLKFITGLQSCHVFGGSNVPNCTDLINVVNSLDGIAYVFYVYHSLFFFVFYRSNLPRTAKHYNPFRNWTVFYSVLPWSISTCWCLFLLVGTSVHNLQYKPSALLIGSIERIASHHERMFCNPTSKCSRMQSGKYRVFVWFDVCLPVAFHSLCSFDIS